MITTDVKAMEAINDSAPINLGLVELNKIAILSRFKNTTPNPNKMVQKEEYLHIYGVFDKPVVLKKNTDSKNKKYDYVLYDGYMTYLLAKKAKMTSVPARELEVIKTDYKIKIDDENGVTNWKIEVTFTYENKLKHTVIDSYGTEKTIKKAVKVSTKQLKKIRKGK